MNTTPRLNWFKTIPKTFEAMLAVSASIDASTVGKTTARLGLRPRLADQRLRLLPRHARARPAQTGRRLAAHQQPGHLARSELLQRARARGAGWAESLTRLADDHDEREAEFAALKAQFSDVEIAELTVAIAQINTWNRINVGMRMPVAVKALD
jgi:hypothetical protein